jgi:signal peptide peptidase SppA
MNHPLHPAVLASLAEHYAMEPRAQSRWLQRLAGVTAETRLPTLPEIQARVQERTAQARSFGFMDWDDDDDEEDYPSCSSSSRPYQLTRGVAVLPLIGCLQPREDWITWLFPEDATALETFCANLQAAASDPDVTGILLYVDSPGGLVSGVPEAADAVYALRQGKKPVTAYAPSQCCSAAYWIASQAAELYCGDAAMLGSIGTRLDLVDSVEFYAKLGLKIEPITTGTYKASGADGTTITDDDRAYYQSIVDRVQVEFTAGVAKGRKLKIDAARALAKEARVYVGGDAVSAGLADGLRSAPDVLNGLQAGTTPAASSGASRPGATAALSGKGEQSMSLSLKDIRTRILAAFRDEDDDAGGAPPGAQAHTTAQNGAASTTGAAPADSGSNGAQAAAPPTPPAYAVGALQPHPLVNACTAAGLTTPEQVQSAVAAITERDTLRASLTARLRADAKRAAVMATGRDMAATVDALPDIPALEAFLQDMQGQAQRQFGNTDTQGATRKSQAANPADGGEGNQKPTSEPINHFDIYDQRREQTLRNGRGV